MNNRFRFAFIAMLAGGLAGGPAAAQDEKDEVERPEVIDALYACRSVADAAQRLACFDAAVERVQAEEARQNVIFADREQVREAKRGLFGLGSIRLGIFSRGEDGPDNEPLEEIEAKVRSVSMTNVGKLMILLEDGALWQQTDGTRLRRRSLEETTVTIKRGILGGYSARLGDGRWFKVKRIE